MPSTNCSRSGAADHRQVEYITVGHFSHLPVGRVPDFYQPSQKRFFRTQHCWGRLRCKALL